MKHAWESWLDRWQGAGLMDAEQVARIRGYEASRPVPPGLRWPIVAALAFGGILLGAGVLLFVAAHWENLSPPARMALVVAMVAGFHGVGAWKASTFPALSTTMHALGTLSLGAGIGLAGQIFHVQSHWPTGILLWALGAWAGAWILRDWIQVGFAALFTPAWILGEWITREEREIPAMAAWLLMLALVYLSARHGAVDSPWRKCLSIIGGCAVLPLAVGVAAASDSRGLPRSLLVLLVPLVALAISLRGRAAWMSVVAFGWVLALCWIGHNKEPVVLHVWAGMGSVAMAAWGIAERRAERVNIGIAGFAVVVGFFYFSTMMDKIGRSFSLIVLGVLFLAGGWYLEKLRRKLLGRIEGLA